MESSNLKKYQNRLFVSDLIFDVLSGKLSVLQALSNFPKEKNDINIKCAFDALMHREADEDLRANDPDYASLQDEYLEGLAFILKDNEKLPQNIVSEYLKYHSDDLVGENLPFVKSILKNIKRMINF